MVHCTSIISTTTLKKITEVSYRTKSRRVSFPRKSLIQDVGTEAPGSCKSLAHPQSATGTNTYGSFQGLGDVGKAASMELAVLTI